MLRFMVSGRPAFLSGSAGVKGILPQIWVTREENAKAIPDIPLSSGHSLLDSRLSQPTALSSSPPFAWPLPEKILLAQRSGASRETRAIIDADGGAVAFPRSLAIVAGRDRNRKEAIMPLQVHHPEPDPPDERLEYARQIIRAEAA